MKTPKLSPFSHGFGRGIKGKRTTKGSCIHPPNKSPRERPQNLSKKIAKKRLRKSPKRKTGRTQTSLEKQRRIIYTYHEGSYKV
jgi:hypothetical protein